MRLGPNSSEGSNASRICSSATKVCGRRERLKFCVIDCDRARVGDDLTLYKFSDVPKIEAAFRNGSPAVEGQLRSLLLSLHLLWPSDITSTTSLHQLALLSLILLLFRPLSGPSSRRYPLHSPHTVPTAHPILLDSIAHHGGHRRYVFRHTCSPMIAILAIPAHPSPSQCDHPIPLPCTTAPLHHAARRLAVHASARCSALQSAQPPSCSPSSRFIGCSALHLLSPSPAVRRPPPTSALLLTIRPTDLQRLAPFAVPTQQHSNGTATLHATPRVRPTMQPGTALAALRPGAQPPRLAVSASAPALPCAPAMTTVAGKSALRRHRIQTTRSPLCNYRRIPITAPSATTATTTQATTSTSRASARPPPSETSRRLSASTAPYVSLSSLFLFASVAQPPTTDPLLPSLLLQQIQRAQVMYDPHTREPRGFAFVTYEKAEDAEAAITAMNGSDFQGRKINVDKARRGRARTPTPGRYFGPPKKGRMDGPPGYGGGGGYGRGPPRGGYGDDRYGGMPPRGGGYPPAYPPRDPYDRYGPPPGRPFSPPPMRGDPYDRYGRGPPPMRDYPPRDRDYLPPPPRGGPGMDYPPRDFPPRGPPGDYPPPRGYRDHSPPPPRGGRYDDLPPPPPRAGGPGGRYPDAPPRPRYDDAGPPPRRY